jgi:glyoxylase-like metal-dependent hydrolase (beta-lactamase superfamily II)
VSYTGSVRVGGPPETRELQQMTITKVAVGPMDNNAYLLRCRRTGTAVLVDAANEAPRLLELIGDGGLAAVVTTHRHGDHWRALREVVDATGAEVIAHQADAPALPVPVARTVADGGEVTVGEVRLEVLHLVGHTPGSIALVHHGDGEHIVTGDSLFPGGPGKTTSPEDFTSLMDDLEEKVFGRLPDSTWVYPGHGADTTLGAERPHLAGWRARGW